MAQGNGYSTTYSGGDTPAGCASRPVRMAPYSTPALVVPNHLPRSDGKEDNGQSHSLLFAQSHHFPITIAPVHPYPDKDLGAQTHLLAPVQSQACGRLDIRGHGSYGSVRAEGGVAIKTFRNEKRSRRAVPPQKFVGPGLDGDSGDAERADDLRYLVQEFAALSYLRDAQHIVRAHAIDLHNFELHLELYDCNLMQWLCVMRSPTERMLIVRDILLGLVELHDRGLAHGDLKPDNILVRAAPPQAVLGDCGFVCVAKYTRVERTALSYREPDCQPSTHHDMYSFALCFLNVVYGLFLQRHSDEVKGTAPGTQVQLFRAALAELISTVSDHQHRTMLTTLTGEKDTRPSARVLLQELFGFVPPVWVRPYAALAVTMRPGDASASDWLYVWYHYTRKEYAVNRSGQGYISLVWFLREYAVPLSEHLPYAAASLLILAAVFGGKMITAHRIEKMLRVSVPGCDGSYTTSQVYHCVVTLLQDHRFISSLMYAGSREGNRSESAPSSRSSSSISSGCSALSTRSLSSSGRSSTSQPLAPILTENQAINSLFTTPVATAAVSP